MQRPSERLNVLLLSGNEEKVGLLREVLYSEVELITAGRLEELFGLLQRAAYDAFLCEWDCPGHGWWEVCRAVKQLYPRLPIIVVSRYGGEREWAEVLEAGCFDMVCAPFSARQVLSVIEHAVASFEGQDRIEQALEAVA